jgi:transcriptional regulator GlxA family with amidase domain
MPTPTLSSAEPLGEETSIMATTKNLGVLLFPGFELLDVCGPLQMFGNLPDEFEIVTISQAGGSVTSRQTAALDVDVTLEHARAIDILLVPGGLGTRKEVDNATLIGWLARRALVAQTVATVCTGAALLARTGLLDGRRATTNKRAFAWVAEQGPGVEWVKQARWVEDGNFWTSSGVSAGIDMALAMIAKLVSADAAEALALAAEYEWQRDPGHDPFAARHGLV